MKRGRIPSVNKAKGFIHFLSRQPLIALGYRNLQGFADIVCGNNACGHGERGP
jgi:hypothetical protein